MGADSIVVLLVVAFAAAFIARRAWSTLQSARAAKRGAAGCAACGCDEGKARARTT